MDTLVIPAVTDYKSALEFLDWAVTRLGGGFHPDTRANGYIRSDDEVTMQVFNASEAIFFDNQIDQVFRFVDDPYEVTVNLAIAFDERYVASVIDDVS
jgi:hypothetical protein